MSAQHTPTPWVAAEQYPIEGLGTRGLCCIQHEQRVPAGEGFNQVSHVVAELCDPSDAAHIVRCVNSHDALVEALRECGGALDGWSALPADKVKALHKTIRTALKAATEGT